MSLITLEGWNRYKETGRYSIKGSLVIALVGTVLLWWLPIFGPMLSGYVAGRAAGNKYKGLLVTSIISVAFGTSAYLLTYVIQIPPMVISYLSGNILYHIQILNPFLGSLIYSVSLMFSSFRTFLLAVPPNWAVLIAFGFLGGSISELKIRDKDRPKLLSQKHPHHNDDNAMKPTVVEYQPEEKPHPLLKKVLKEKAKEEDAADEYI
ncbi:MAG: hypothetical protein M1526_06845 [Candidatus Thermoplasmatota archaeon]|jgi:hypothetical protein|nr:hypothetical protein [Candidatus Thermoplasmatota archaeon]